jgi:hypothetical protein
MKYLKPILPVVLFFALSIGFTGTLMTGCTTSHQQIAYNTVWSLEKLTTTTYDGYLGLVIDGALSTNSVPNISRKYNTTQLAILVALDGVQYNTNALAPHNLVVTVNDFVNLVNDIKKDIQ